MAAGEPAPAAPSRKMGTIMPTITSCTRRSWPLTRATVFFTSSMAPVFFRVFRMTKAPKTMATILRPSLMPFQSKASITTTFSLKVRPLMLK